MPTSYLAPTSLEAARSRVREEVAKRHDDSAQQVVGISLGPSATFEEVLAAIESTGSSQLCLMVDCVLWQWKPDQFGSLRSALQLDGSDLFFLEPVATFGPRRALHRLGRAYFLKQKGHHYEADVPALLRQAGFGLNTVDRFDVGLGSYAWGHVFSSRNASSRES